MRWAVAAFLFMVGCDPGSHLLVIDLRTDLIPLVEMREIEVVVDDAEAVVIEVDPATDYVAGARLIELPGVVGGTHRIEVSATSWGDPVLTRPILLELSSDLVVTAVLTRDCRGVECPGDGAPGQTACLAGQCVDPTCTPETAELCPTTPDCATDSECAGGSICTAASCVGGACLYGEAAGMCAPEEFCSPESGCRDNSGVEGRWQLTGTDDTLFFVFDLSGSAAVAGERYTAAGSGTTDLFIQARENDGDTIRYTRQFGTGNWEWADDVATYGSDLVVAGVAKDSTVFEEWGITIDVDGHDGFVAVFDGATGDPTFAIGAPAETGESDVTSVAVAPDGTIYGLLEYTGPVSVGAFSATPPMGEDGFIRSYAVFSLGPAPGWAPAWLVEITGAVPRELAASDAGVWIVGDGGATPTIGALAASPPGENDAFVALIAPGGAPAWVETFGGPASAQARDVTIDSFGNAHVLGSVEGSGATLGSFMVDSTGGTRDVVVAGMDPTGAFLFATLVGGNGADEPARITYDDASASVVLVATAGVAFDHAGIELGDPSAQAIVQASVDEAGGPRGGGTWFRGESAESWQTPSGFAVTGTGRQCLVGRAPSDYDAYVYRGTTSSMYMRCTGP